MTGRIEFVFLRMDRSPPTAPHPASQRRSCSRLQAGERIPEGDLHPSVQYLQHYVRLQAHERGRPGRKCGRNARRFQAKTHMGFKEI